MLPKVHTEKDCEHEECRYLRAHKGHRADECRKCGGTVHAIASDWGDYSFGHSGGPVWFLTKCPSCGAVEEDNCLGLEWAEEDLKRAQEFTL